MKQWLLLFLLPACLQAQPRKDGRQLVALPINSKPDLLNNPNGYYLIVDKPACVLLKPNQTFILQSAWHKEGDSIVQIGMGTLAKINKNDAELKATLRQGKMVQTGDVAMFLVPLKQPGKDSLLFKLARFAISLTTVADSAFYDRNKMLQNPMQYPTKKLAAAMVTDIKYTAQMMLEQLDSQDQEITSGKYKGQQLFTMMQACTTTDILQFLKYIYAKPNKYMAHNWKVSETFATWVINGAP